MTEAFLKPIFNAFDHGGRWLAFKTLGSGHINDTFLVLTDVKPYFVLQRINKDVFNNVPALVANKVAVSQHLGAKLKKGSDKKWQQQVLSFVPSKQGLFYFQDNLGQFWNLMRYIDGSVTYETVPNEDIAYEAGKSVGKFLRLTEDFDAQQLVAVLPRFHDMAYRFSQFEAALERAAQERLIASRECVEKVSTLKAEMHQLQTLKDNGELKIRVTHNDTKISNVLFNQNGEGLCVIDTDTVMPGLVHYDFGDAIRTICNTAKEDETDLNKVTFNLKYYKAYKKGFLEQMATSLSPTELQCLPLGAKTMVFIMALRFLTDYLNEDVYYKVQYEAHNLDRAKNQLKLLDSLVTQLCSQGV